MNVQQVMEAIGSIGFLITTLIITPAVVLHDVDRHQPAPGPAHADRGAMTAGGVPYVMAGR
jgi:hypothetical protein